MAVEYDDRLVYFGLNTQMTACELFGFSCEAAGSVGSAVAAICSLVVALVALCVTTWQVIVTREHNRKSVRPILRLWNSHSANPLSYKITLCNIGIGPAIIKSFDIFVDGHKIDGSAFEPIDKAVNIIFPSNTPTILYRSYLTKGGALAAKEEITVIELRFTPGTEPSAAVMDHLQKRVKLVVKFTSIYEEMVYIYDSILNHATD